MSRVHSTGPLRLLGFTLKSKTRDDPHINWTEETVYKFMASPQESFYFCWVGEVFSQTNKIWKSST